MRQNIKKFELLLNVTIKHCVTVTKASFGCQCCYRFFFFTKLYSFIFEIQLLSLIATVCLSLCRQICAFVYQHVGVCTSTYISTNILIHKCISTFKLFVAKCYLVNQWNVTQAMVRYLPQFTRPSFVYFLLWDSLFYTPIARYHFICS